MWMFSSRLRELISGVLGKSAMLEGPRSMVLSQMETGARLLVTRFLQKYVSVGTLILCEDGGTILTFGKPDEKCTAKSVLRVHSPLFYWKVAAEADLGLADSYINGFFSFADQENGLLDLFTILIANRDLKNASTSNTKKSWFRGWWSPILLTAGVASAMYFFRHMLRRNSVTQARRNISQHYDLSNDFFSLFLDETMTYSCAIFKTQDEDLKAAQLHKISLLIDKARVASKHEVLEIGCGWGSLAIELVKRSGCKYTGITLAEEQLKYAKEKVKDAGLEGSIKFLLCDYRQLLHSQKYDRIISCEMIEAVGHEYMGEFFSSCETLLAEDGVFVLQFTSIPDERYDEYRRSSDFIKEHIFPGCCIPSLSRITSAMSSSSRLCVQHVDNIGIHFFRTLIHWRRNFAAKKEGILALGFDEKFFRTWEYYFLYCAAGFKSCTLGNYQIVFSRPGNTRNFGDSYGEFTDRLELGDNVPVK